MNRTMNRTDFTGSFSSSQARFESGKVPVLGNFPFWAISRFGKKREKRLPSTPRDEISRFGQNSAGHNSYSDWAHSSLDEPARLCARAISRHEKSPEWGFLVTQFIGSVHRLGSSDVRTGLLFVLNPALLSPKPRPENEVPMLLPPLNAGHGFA